MYDREVYFDVVRESLFGGSMSDQQVVGQSSILNVWELWLPAHRPEVLLDERWLAYMLATTYHETAKEMMPIEEYGKGAGMEYGAEDPETGQTYYGRGYVQLTWRENYAKADEELHLVGDDNLEWHADQALDPVIAAKVMYAGMYQGWFRGDDEGRQTLPRYFSETVDDPFEAREIINGDKNKIPDWSGGESMGEVIETYHYKFLTALEAAREEKPQPDVEPNVVINSLTLATGTPYEFWVNTNQVARGVAE